MSLVHGPHPADRPAGDEPAVTAGPRGAGDAARIAAGWQRRFVVDQSRVVEMVGLYQSLGYETALDPIGPEDPPAEPAGEGAAGERPDPRCGECRLVTMRWLHILYTRPARPAHVD